MKKQHRYQDYIGKLSSKGIVLGLDIMKELLSELGDPQEQLRIIHVAGTNGKGSVFAFLSSMLMAEGFRVGRYVSPTIVCYEERFQINGEYISSAELDDLFESVWQAAMRLAERGVGLPSIFEAETAIAFLYFLNHKVDYVLLETGMGGRLDATNIIKAPVLSVIVSVSFDHMQFLGETIEEIAAEKAGIVKKGCPVLVGENTDAVLKVIREKAGTMNSPCIMVDPSSYHVIEERFDGSKIGYKEENILISLPGRHQISNAMTAIRAWELIRHKSIKGCERVIHSLNSTNWPGRLEILERSPLLIRDGAHNHDGALKLKTYVQKHFTNKRIIYIMGILRDKAYDAMIKELLPTASAFYVFKPQNARGLEAEKLKEVIENQAQVPVFVHETVRDALSAARKEAQADDVLMVCGSLSFMEEMEQTC